MHPWGKFRKTAFTLAEVLITLAIIGVVAAIVLPTLINNSKEAEFHAAWKKKFAEFSQAAKMADKDGIMLHDICDYNHREECLNDFLNYMRYTKKCWNGVPVLGVCFASNPLFLNKVSAAYATNPAGAILPDGSSFAIDVDIQVDVNGPKPPNVWGRDIYVIEIKTNNQLIPAGAFGTYHPLDGWLGQHAYWYCDNNSTNGHNLGDSCSVKYLYE